ncbi:MULTISPECIES: Fe(3+) ABC transporter substrate-binding protein [Marinobacter]|uniref:Iron ABC transporter substrate-binding protein n=1 Tax=Marinobacter nauticus TaxID=2743 RepID=A0A455WDG5_MARNT|nr:MULTISPECIES: Fe(3+) ABC transporter substrate-binding protein [Marinobacter]WBU39664.1 Fe(3+) ABC transporter substrate-binding protein [Marinobacter alkaliphilus]BBJ04313.1 iron ABC transporter substrate-binding protein [Marinobacter nauticus]MAO12910.1 iron ABC transporter substrate-binding protein [Marinobacter sp.]MCD1630352.1 Fe(3+) ABC transporter substrate-binding protein [Marinobacter shengliensis]BEH14877.1 iron ABC transporter substrate-binding protein [Marinobacter shengliensis]
MRMKLAAAVAIALTATPMAATADGEVNIYSYRQAYLLEPLLNAFTDETGIKTNVVFAKQGLAERLEREGRNSPADVVMTVDISRINELVEKNLVAEVDSDTVNKNIPENLRHPDGKWFALTTRGRLIFTSKDRVEEGEISTYEDLTDAKWKGRICTRSGKHPYNVALVSSMIAHHGEEKAQEWLQGVKDNLARKPQGGDRDQIRAIAEGVCDLALGNSYYYGNMLMDENQRPTAEQVNLVFPNANDRGTHVNISGISLTQSAPNKDNAIKLIEFLSSPSAQRIYAEANSEYPANPEVKPTGMVAEWGEMNPDTLSLQEIANNRNAAVRLIDRVDYDG